ncbi:hypothetical protein FRB99_003545 [Tulasnella sp. 403]|nr:hypothetical protein FRB99_003545 [Tulasnella sp. 403]
MSGASVQARPRTYPIATTLDVAFNPKPISLPKTRALITKLPLDPLTKGERRDIAIDTHRDGDRDDENLTPSDLRQPSANPLPPPDPKLTPSPDISSPCSKATPAQVGDTPKPTKQTLRPRDRFLIPLSQALNQNKLEEAWDAYKKALDHPNGRQLVRTSHLHSLIALLATSPQTRTRKTFVRMSEIVAELRRRGPGKVREWEWNSMISAASNGFRKTTWDDYQSAVDVLKEWEADLQLLKDKEAHVALTRSRTHTRDGTRKGELRQNHDIRPTTFDPSITTYEILVSIACRTGAPRLIHDARLRMEPHLGSPIPSTRYTHLSHITFLRLTDRHDQIPKVLVEMVSLGYEIGVDGINAALWAYGYKGELDVVKGVYDMLMENLKRCQGKGIRRLWLASSKRNPILRDPSVYRSLSEVVPDYRTYTMVMQCYAVHGQLLPALEVLQNFLDWTSASTPSSETKAFDVDEPSELQIDAAFRALFHGFRMNAPGSQVRTPFRGVSLKDATAWLVRHSGRDTGAASDEPHDATPLPNISPPTAETLYTMDTLLYLYHSYMAITSSFISDAEGPPRVPSKQYLRTILDASKKTAENEEEAQAMVRYVWRSFVRERLRPCGAAWEEEKNKWGWFKLRRDFGLEDLEDDYSNPLP